MSAAETQKSVLDKLRRLSDLGVPEEVLAPIRHWATVTIWHEAAERTDAAASSSRPGKEPA